mmetsp:Transcript_62860/g.118899  ORF Transcript_62860/g.118899 Transcript_62860/m.118899 type:complete len:256 (+) Transcript_62860:1071-1838(+)
MSIMTDLHDQHNLCFEMVVDGDAFYVTSRHHFDQIVRRLHDVRLALQAANDQIRRQRPVQGASGHSHWVKVCLSKRWHSSKNSDGVVLHETIDQIPDRLTWATIWIISSVAKGVDEPASVTSRWQALASFVAHGRSGAPPQMFNGAALRVTQPSANRRTRQGEVIVCCTRHLGGIGCPSRDNNKPHTKLLASVQEEIRRCLVELIVVRRVCLEICGDISIRPSLKVFHTTHDDNLCGLLHEELLIISKEECRILQ